ncbi:hypothetical protein [Inquilinus sp.]|uniref:hypothetical protein n=1 Tax=Inquilinus sp. TaxID=1932117 RepID=UPI0031CEC28D
MRSAVIIFAAAIVARAAITPVYYLIEDNGDDAAPAPVAILAGSLERCEQALAASPAPRVRCESISGFRHLLASADSALAALRQAAEATLQPVSDLQDSTIDAMQDAATSVVQDAAVDAVQDAIGGEDDSPVE